MRGNFTEGARRTLEACSALARSLGARRSPAHLLVALLEDESRAAEILLASRIRREIVEAELLKPAPDADVLPISSGDEALFDEVVEAGRARARLEGRHTELGTEHLLFGLCAVASPAASFLERHGITAESLVRHSTLQGEFSTEAISVDIHLDPSDGSGSERARALRILDAATNRAREALRVIEDAVRFTLEDPHLTGLLKQLRHDLTAVLSRLDSNGLIHARDTRRDVGTKILTPTEAVRASTLEVLTANFKRLEEAARTLEEFSKVVAPGLAGPLEQLRYECYTTEKAVLTTCHARDRLEGRTLYLLVSGHGDAGELEKLVAAAIGGGVDIVQLREKQLDDRALLDLGRRLCRRAHEAGALFIMNDRPDLAVLVEADGVHVGQEELPVHAARQIVGPERLVGVSTHSMEQARQAVLDGADYLGVGPVFPSSTKSFDEFPGLEFVAKVAAEITRPWFAIGGIDYSNIEAAREAGASRVAVGGCIVNSENPTQAAQQLADALRGPVS